MRVLLVEDDDMIAQAIDTALRHEGYVLDRVADAGAASAALHAQRFDLVLLDLGLPGARDGLSVLSELRKRNDATPVLVITARDALPDRVRGLDSGADDYLVKPFELDELSARIRALLRRADGRGETAIEHRDLRLDPLTHAVSQAGRAVDLSRREFALLQALLRRPGAVLSRAQLEESLYGWNEPVESNAVEVHVHGLRRKLGADAIRTRRGVGYYVPADDAGDEA